MTKCTTKLGARRTTLAFRGGTSLSARTSPAHTIHSGSLTVTPIDENGLVIERVRSLGSRQGDYRALRGIGRMTSSAWEKGMAVTGAVIRWSLLLRAPRGNPC